MGNCGTTPTDGANVFALKFKVIFRDSTQNIFFSKHPNKAEFKDMDTSEVRSPRIHLVIRRELKIECYVLITLCINSF